MCVYMQPEGVYTLHMVVVVACLQCVCVCVSRDNPSVFKVLRKVLCIYMHGMYNISIQKCLKTCKCTFHGHIEIDHRNHQ